MIRSWESFFVLFLLMGSNLSCSSSDNNSKNYRKALANRFPHLFNNVKKTICVVGLDYSGKTTLLENWIAFGKPDRIYPSIGCNISETIIKSTKFIALSFHMNSQRIITRLKNFFDDSVAVILVIDSEDSDRFEESQLNFELFCKNIKHNVSILVYLNKKDKIIDAKFEEIEKVFKFDCDSRVHFQPICALTGKGVYEGLSWLDFELK